MKKVTKNLTDLIGNTPLLELCNISKTLQLNTSIYAKLECFNPGGSIKDRIAYAMINDAEKKGLLKKDTVIIEPTSGNTGIALAYIAALKKYRLILTMPETMSLERRNVLKALGAQVILTPAVEGMAGAIRKANELAADIPNSLILQQFKNHANPQIHRETTAQEIWNDMNGNIDIFVAGVGTGGTITGIGEVLKNKNPNSYIVAVEPNDSPVLSGGNPGPHKIQGIGAGFIPEILNLKIIDEIFKVTNDDAFETTRLLAKNEGLFVGISSGAAAYSAIQLAKRSENKNKKIVVIFPDTGERYLSTQVFNID